MRSIDFYNKFNEKIKDLNFKELKDVINNVIRKISENKYEEVLNIFNVVNNSNEQEIVNKIQEYKEKFELIDNFELYFHASGYEDYGDSYSPWGGDWIWEYSDEDNVSSLIEEAIILGIELTNQKQYKYAKELFDLVIYANYHVLDDDGEDYFEISLTELKENYLININVETICLYAIYATYQCVDDCSKARVIYEYFKNENFKDISIEDSFKLGVEVLKETDKFWNNWISLLLLKSGNIEYRLLKEALDYTNYKNYKKYIDKLSQNHPKIYIDIFNHLINENKIDEIVNIGNKVLSLLNKDLIIRNDIALYLAKYDESNKEKYIIESFKSNTNVPNLLRIINNGYYSKYKNEIDKIICVNENRKTYFEINELEKNIINKEDYDYLKFFTGNFDYFFDECIKTKTSLGWSIMPIQYNVYLWLLYLNRNNNSKVYNSIIYSTFDELGFKEDMLFLDDEYTLIFNKWKKNFEINDKGKFINWLQSIIEKRVDAIVSNGHRGSYFKAAILVVALAEVFESNNIQQKQEFVNKYHQKYSRHSSFRKELNKYM